MIRDGGWHRSVTGVARRTFQSAWEDNVPFLASALAFDLLLTFPPFALLLLGVFGYLVQQQVDRADVALHDLITQFLPSSAGFGGLEALLTQVVANRSRLTLLGAVLFFWFSARAFGGLRAALNEVFDVEERRPWPVAKLLDLVMVIVTGTLLVFNAYLSVLGVRGEFERAGITGWLWRFVVQLATVSFSTVLFLGVFKLMPSRRIPWRTALVAATFSAVLFEAAKRLFALYLVHFTTFDRLTSDANMLGVFLFLLWVYFTCFIFLLGGEVAETYDMIRRRRAQRVRLG